MDLESLVIDPGSLVRAYLSCFSELNHSYGGRASEEFHKKVAELGASCTMVSAACSGEAVPGVYAVSDLYDDKEAVLVFTPMHKLIFIKVGLSSEQYYALKIFER